MLDITVHMVPPTVTKQSRINRRGGGTCKSKRLIAAEEELYMQFFLKKPLYPILGPKKCKIVLVWPYRKSDVGTLKKRDRTDLIYKTSVPDCDNTAKLILDSINIKKEYYEDDAYISVLQVIKYYGPDPMIQLMIWEL